MLKLMLPLQTRTRMHNMLYHNIIFQHSWEQWSCQYNAFVWTSSAPGYNTQMLIISYTKGDCLKGIWIYLNTGWAVCAGMHRDGRLRSLFMINNDFTSVTPYKVWMRSSIPLICSIHYSGLICLMIMLVPLPIPSKIPHTKVQATCSDGHTKQDPTHQMSTSH